MMSAYIPTEEEEQLAIQLENSAESTNSSTQPTHLTDVKDISITLVEPVVTDVTITTAVQFESPLAYRDLTIVVQEPSEISKSNGCILVLQCYNSICSNVFNFFKEAYIDQTGKDNVVVVAVSGSMEDISSNEFEICILLDKITASSTFARGSSQVPDPFSLCCIGMELSVAASLWKRDSRLQDLVVIDPPPVLYASSPSPSSTYDPVTASIGGDEVPGISDVSTRSLLGWLPAVAFYMRKLPMLRVTLNVRDHTSQ